MLVICAQKQTNVRGAHLLDWLATSPHCRNRRSHVRDFFVRKRLRDYPRATEPPAGGKNSRVLLDHPVHRASTPIGSLLNSGLAICGRIEACLGPTLKFIGGGPRKVRAMRLRIADREGLRGEAPSRRRVNTARLVGIDPRHARRVCDQRKSTAFEVADHYPKSCRTPSPCYVDGGTSDFRRAFAKYFHCRKPDINRTRGASTSAG